jgi:hypothetical protein
MMASRSSSSSRIATRRLFFTMHPQRRRFYLTAAAALGSSLAFAPAPSVHRRSFHSWTFQSGPSALTPALQQQPSHLYQTRLYSYKNKNDNEKDSGEERDSTSAFLSQVF